MSVKALVPLVAPPANSVVALVFSQATCPLPKHTHYAGMDPITNLLYRSHKRLERATTEPLVSAREPLNAAVCGTCIAAPRPALWI